MVRHNIRRPALVLAVGLVVAFTTFFGSGTAPLTSRPVAPQTNDGPSVVTDSQGHFRFGSLHSASHLLRLDTQTLPTDIQPRSADLTMTLSPGVTQSLAVAPGLALRATYHNDGTVLDGVLFRDLNGDGQQSPDEVGLAGARVIDPDVYQYFVPFNDNDLYTSFADVLGAACLNNPNVSTTIASTISMTPSSSGTTLYYDHWEDGYDPDPIVPGPTTQTITGLGPGQVQTWQNNIPIPRTQTVLRDGRDRITIIGQPATGVRAAWLTQPGTVLAGAWEMAKVSDWGTHYIIPVGEDIGRRGTQTFGDYDYVSAEVMAAYDNTVVQIDTNADGLYETTQTINAGQTVYVRGSANQQGIAIHSGAQVSASLPVQVQVRAGNCRAPYSGRSYTLVPVEKWSNDYWSPVSSFATGQNGCVVDYLPPQNGRGLSADVDIYIFNPNAAPLPVTYEDTSGTGTLTIPPRSTGSYLNLHPKPLVRSNTQGVHLTAPNPFWAVTAVDSTSLGNNGADFDWSYSLIPAKELSGRVVLGWAPASSAPPPPPRQNISGSTVYVQATTNGTIVKADLTRDGVPDTFDTDGNGALTAVSAYGYNELTSNNGITLNKGQMLRISNPVTHDMTGANISSQDYAHPLAVVYGEDACIAGPQTPFLDLGYTVLPLPVPEFSKNSRLLIDADRSGDISPGDTLEYRVQATNNGTGPIINPVILDTLPYTYTSFVIGSIFSIPPAVTPPGITYDNGSGTFTYVPTGAPGTPDPNVHAIKANYPDLVPGSTILITLHIQLKTQIPPNVFSVINNASLTSSNTPPVTSQVTNPINQVDLLIHKTDGRVTVNPLEPITYTLTYTNAGPGIAHNVIMTDTLPPTAFNVSSPPQPGVITPTIQPGRVIFQLGTLQPGQVGQTTISLKLSTLTTGAVVNTVVIGTSSHEINLNNNRSVDIDQVPPCDLLIHKTDGREQVQRGDTLTYTLTFTNTGPGFAFNAVVTDTFPATAINVSSPPMPGVITPTIDLAQHRITLQLGTLPPGHVGQTTVSMTVGPNQANGVDFVNTAAISTTSTETNVGNNISTDTDKVRATAVVLSEFNAGRQAGGVMVFWRTVAEQDNYGFRLYRSRTPKRADAVLITPAIIPGQGRGSAGGASYSFFDADAPDGPVYYWLEDIDLNGHSEFHGPAEATIQAGRFRVLMPLVVTGR